MSEQTKYIRDFSFIRLLFFLFCIGACYFMYDRVLGYVYFSAPSNGAFSHVEKSSLSSYWQLAFYIHIVSGLITMLAGASQFPKRARLKQPERHRLMGRIYTVITLFLAAPTGLVLSFVAEGGFVGQFGFAAQSYFWWLFTFIAYYNLRTLQIRKYYIWMLRSYALTLSAVTFHVLMLLFEYSSLPLHYEEHYIFNAWACWIVNILIVELLIRNGLVDDYMK